MSGQDTHPSSPFSDIDEQEYVRLAEQMDTFKQPSQFSDVDEHEYVKMADRIEKDYQQRKQKNKDLQKYQCDECGKRFTQKSNLTRHQLSHMYRVKCHICNKQFRRKDVLKRHMAHIHGVSVSSANITMNRQPDHGSNSPTPSTSQAIPESQAESFASQQNTAEIRKTSVRRAINNSAEIVTISPEGNEQYDVLAFLANTRATVEEHLLRRVEQRGVKWYLCVQIELERPTTDGHADTTRPHFRSHTYILLNRETYTEHELNQAIQKIMQSLEQFLRDGSSWIVKKIIHLELYTVIYSPLSASSYLPLPKSLQQSHSLVNIRNYDMKCFTWSVLAALHPQTENPETIQHYRPYEYELDMSGILNPVSISKLDLFEKQNNGISVNVFAYESNEIFPLRITKQRQREHHVNLLYLSEKGQSHYCLIMDLNRFLARTKSTKHKTWFCCYCLTGFTQERLLVDHVPYCESHGAQKVKLPTPGENILEFKDFEKTLAVPFMIYADFECLNKPLHEQNDTKPTVHTSELEPCAYAYKVVCQDSKYTKPTQVYSGPDAALTFIEAVLAEQEEIQHILNHIQPMNLTPADKSTFTAATHCCICEHEFSIYDKQYEERIVRHHCHLTGHFIGAAHNRCNVNCEQAKFIPVVFHNLRGFDGHLLCQGLGHFKSQNIKCIAQNMEKYISFSLGSLRFIDSLQFMNSSLDALVENLKLGDSSAFHYFYEDFPNQEHAHLLMRKGVFPYQYLDSEERLQETQLPPRKAFYSHLTQEYVSEEDYQHALNVFDTLQLQTLDDYMQVYVKCDVSLLCCVFEQFRQVCLHQYKLDPAHFYSAPGLSWSAALKMTQVKLELMTDIDQILFIEKGIRGGISQVSNRHAVANNPYLGADHFDSTQPHSFLNYQDMNNLYAFSMVQKLPKSDFRFLNPRDLSQFDVMQVPDDGDTGYILEVSLEYPPSIHDYTNEFPLCPEKRHIEDHELSPYAQQMWKKLHGTEHKDTLQPTRPRVEKLLCTLNDKEYYVVHYKTLQLYIQLGMKVKCIHRVLAFHQEAFLKPYIDFNTECRKQAKSEFEKTFYKGMNCSLFGKTLQNPRKFVDVQLVQTEKKLRKLSAKPSFKRFKLFNEGLVGVECAYTKVNMCYPFYCGMTILDLSKHCMYDFFYKYLKPKFGKDLSLQYCDTDSLIFLVYTDDFYSDMKQDLHMFDTSNYPKDHPLYSEERKKKLGIMKDELGGFPMREFVGLRPKMYSYVYIKNNQTVSDRRCKGISRSTVEKDLHHEHYKRTLTDSTRVRSTMHSLQSENHIVYCNRITKIGLSPFCDKRWLKQDAISSLAYGHYAIKNHC